MDKAALRSPTQRAAIAGVALLVGTAALAVWYIGHAPVEGEFRWPIHQLRLGLLVIVALCGALMRRAPVPASVGALAFGLPLAVLHATDQATWFAVLMAVAFGAIVLAVGGRTAVAIALLPGIGLGYVVDWGERAFYGNTHPSSTIAQPDAVDVEWAWSGGVTGSAATVVAKLTDPAAGPVAVLLLSTDDIETARQTARPDEHGIVRAAFDGLVSDVEYRYAVEVDGRLDAARTGRFRTFPTGPASFTFAVASCARTGSNGRVFDEIAEREPLFYANIGDLHYRDISRADPQPFLDAYDEVMALPAQAHLYRSTPFIYTWDDHDAGPDNTNGESPTIPAAREAYEEAVPYYPLLEGSLGQSFTVGRVRFLLTDARSARSPQSDVDGLEKTMLGAEQRDWLLGELDVAAADPTVGLVVWLQPVPWIAPVEAGADHWGAYAVERRAIADRIVALGLTDRLLMISGDAHMLAIDDGTNSDFSSVGAEGFPVLQAAALDRPREIKGGPYSEGIVAEPGQFGFVTIDDDGSDVTVSLSGRNWTGAEVLRYRFTVG